MKVKTKPALTAKKLKQIRLKLGKSPDEFAELLQLSKSSLIKKERDERGITLKDELLINALMQP